jgi:hypothetical protein
MSQKSKPKDLRRTKIVFDSFPIFVLLKSLGGSWERETAKYANHAKVEAEVEPRRGSASRTQMNVDSFDHQANKQGMYISDIECNNCYIIYNQPLKVQHRVQHSKTNCYIVDYKRLKVQHYR